MSFISIASFKRREPTSTSFIQWSSERPTYLRKISEKSLKKVRASI